MSETWSSIAFLALNNEVVSFKNLAGILKIIEVLIFKDLTGIEKKSCYRAFSPQKPKTVFFSLFNTIMICHAMTTETH